MRPADPGRPDQVFRIGLGPGVWRVSHNGAFFGDYLTRGNAVRAAYAGARFEEGRGRVAHVFESPGTTALPHHEPHLGA